MSPRTTGFPAAANLGFLSLGPRGMQCLKDRRCNPLDTAAGLEAISETRDRSVYAGLEWLVPTAIVVTQKCVGTLLQEAARQLLSPMATQSALPPLFVV